MVTLDTFDIAELLDFAGGWYPDRVRRPSRWDSWETFLAEWDAIRDACLSGSQAWMSVEDDVLPFAEWVLQEYGATGPSAIDTLPVHYSEYRSVLPQPTVLVRYWAYRASVGAQ